MASATLEVSRFLATLDDDDPRVRFAHLAGVCGWTGVDAGALEVAAPVALDERDVAAARQFGGSVKCVLWATYHDDDDRNCIEAFAGPALVPLASPLTPLDGERDPVQFSGRYLSGLTRPVAQSIGRAVIAPKTEWFVCARFPGVTPHVDGVSALFETHSLTTRAAISDGRTHWCRIAAAPRADVDRAITKLRVRHRVTLSAIRAL